MKKKYSLTLDDEFIQYCELNKITDIEKLAKQTFNRGFTMLKYGESPSIEMMKLDIDTNGKKLLSELGVPKNKFGHDDKLTPKKTKDLYGE
jgi:hypothetical protein